MPFPSRVPAALLLASVLLLPFSVSRPTVAVGQPAAPPAEAIKPERACEKVGQECVVEFAVKSTRRLEDKNVCFLNSKPSPRDPDNFTAVIFAAGLERLKAAGVGEPEKHYKDRTVRVSGVVKMHKERAEIVVESADQLEIVEAGRR